MAKQQELRPFRVGPADPLGPSAVVSRRAGDSLRNGSAWVYRSDVEQVHPTSNSTAIAPGALVTVLDGRGMSLGTALFSNASQITLRLVSEAARLDRAHYLAELEQHLTAALSLRDRLAPHTSENNACRLIFAEADRTPGIIIDRYNDLAIVQLLTQGTAQNDVRDLLSKFLGNLPDIATVVERPDPRIRIAEDLGETPVEPLYSRDPEPKLATEFTLNGLHFAYDAASGQKTGAFLDQRLNYAAAAHWAHGKALDICTYQGGFALHLARVCSHVTGVDASRQALQVADKNLDRNLSSLRAKVDWMEADAFDLLREYESTGRRYDAIVLDPPAFAKSSRALEGAMRGYKEMNLRALKMLNPGGILVTCSCSQHVSLEAFQTMLTSAAIDAQRRVQLLEVRGAAPDHPAIVTLAETNYLKCLICRIV